MPPDPVVTALRAAGCVFAEEEAAVVRAAATGPAHLRELVERRCEGEPLELVVGSAEIAGTRVRTARGVFVPRVRSAALVRAAAAVLRAGRTGPAVVDLGCGTGALLLAALHAADVEATAYAIDASPAAVACARANLPAAVPVLLGTGLGVLPERLRGRVDLVIANLPYVPTAAIPLLPREAREHEPLVALDGGPDGLRPYAAAVAEAPRWLRPGGAYLAELHASQVEAALRIAAAVDLRGEVGTAEDGTAVLRLTSASA